MADEWNVPEINEWWLPDENACPPVVRSIQAFMEDRHPQEGGQSRSEDQRNIKGIFSKLSFFENPQLKEESDSNRGIMTATALGQARARGHLGPSQVDEDQIYEKSMMNEDVEMQQATHEFQFT